MPEPLTIFTIPKAFTGHAGIIQTNAIRSWAAHHLHIVLVGNDPGVQELATELGATHLPDAARTEHGTPLLDWAFRRADEAARGRWVIFANADILFPDDPTPVLDRLGPRDALAVGRRTNADITTLLDFATNRWRDDARAAAAKGHLFHPSAIDYFAFPRGSRLRELPPFAVGRPGWDNWYCDRALSLGLPLIDLTDALLAVHQNHDYSHIKGGGGKRHDGPDSRRNIDLAQGRYREIGDATMRLTRDGRLLTNHFAAARALWRQRSPSARLHALAHLAHPASWPDLARRAAIARRAAHPRPVA
ncbi:MAG: hypothetical protein ACKVW3_07705 [Phycisphaerales bacterium]